MDLNMNRILTGQRIKEIRKMRKISQTELAEKLGYFCQDGKTGSKSSISKIEKGTVNITLSKVEEIAHVLDVSPTDIIVSAKDFQNQICDLLSRCYKKQSYDIVKKFLKLDETDQLIISSTIDTLLTGKKYSTQEGLKNA